MPREKAIKNMLKATQKFEVELHEFLGKDYEGASPDRAAYPETGSLAGGDGSFVLYRLTGSPLFESLKSSIQSIAETADDVFAETPGKATFDWIRRAVSWIESLQAAVSYQDPLLLGYGAGPKLIIPSWQARKLLKEGEEILLDVPDDLRRTLSQHKIYVSTTKEGKLTVKSKKGGAHHAVGVTAIRWCPLLFDSLKADCEKLDRWEDGLRRLSSSFTSFIGQWEQPPTRDEDFLLKYHGFREEVAELMTRAADLVVAPQPSLLDSTRRLLFGIDSCLAANSNPIIARKYAVYKFTSSASVARDRFELLECLVSRRAESRDDSNRGEISARDGPFRSAARSLLEVTLCKAVTAMAVLAKGEQTAAFCALKAWEIEQELFELHQGTTGERQITPEYREKARALKRSLEDPANVSFTVRVLIGEIDTGSLARMSTEDLASEKVKYERAKAAASVQQTLVLGTPKDEKRPGSVSHRKKEASELPATSEAEVGSQASAENINSKAKSGATSTTPFSIGNFAEATQRVSLPPPPPPPSLAASLRKTQTRSAPLLSNSEGSDRVMFSIGGGSRKFTAGFVVETDPDYEADGLLPAMLVDKGRLAIDEYAKFVKSKLESGRWKAMTLRLQTFSDKDAKDFKRFYKDYESRQRIAMFGLDADSKLFLVTPKFHRAVNSIKFNVPTSTYAVVLRRDRSMST